MPDREKVIKGLECCANPTPTYCRKCPYKGTPDDYPKCIYERLVVDALALLREMEPVEPIKKPGIVEPYKCGACGAVLGWESEKQRFCPKCGRGIKWNA